jgi:hypothetical protein
MAKHQRRRRAARRKFDPLPNDPDLPIIGAENICLAQHLLTQDGEPDAKKLYNRVHAGYYDGIIHKQGGLLVTTLNQLRQVGTRSISPKTA